MAAKRIPKLTFSQIDRFWKQAKDNREAIRRQRGDSLVRRQRLPPASAHQRQTFLRLKPFSLGRDYPLGARASLPA